MNRFVIETTLPDGKNWFKGVAEIGPLKTRMNIWTTVFTDLDEGEGIFGEGEANSWKDILEMDGLMIRPFMEVVVEQSKSQ